MTTPYIGEIRIVGFTFAPLGWLDCNGATLSISGNEALFNLIGTTYGGDGQTNFQLPNLQSRVPVHQGTSAGGHAYPMGANGGAETVTLTSQQVAVHSHAIAATTSGQQTAPSSGTIPASVSGPSNASLYGPKTTPTTLNPASIGGTGGNAPHANIQPYTALRFIIATEGVYPTQS